MLQLSLFTTLLALFSQFAFAQTEPVKLRWVNIPFASSYEIEVESSGAKGRPLVVRTVAIPELGVDLPPGAYLYRVRGVAAKGKGPWSEKQRFDVKPEAVTLLTPAPDFKADAGARIAFSWKTASGYRYRIQIIGAKGTVSDREVTDGSFTWTASSPGVYRWRVAYANLSDANWSETRAVRVMTPANIAVNTKLEKPHSRWSKTLWAGAYMNSLNGDFADAGNNVTASTLSGSYAWELERRHEHFSPYPEPRPSLMIGVKQQSLVKKAVWLPDLSLGYSHLWAVKYLKIGPIVNAGYAEEGIFTGSSSGDYNTGSFWRATYSAGAYGEYLFKKLIVSSFVKFGAASAGNSSLAEGGIKPASTFEAGLGGKLTELSRWTVLVRLRKEDIRWISSLGNNSLTGNIWSLDLGGEL